MTLRGWREVVKQCATDPVLADLTAKLLKEQDDAKQLLRVKGYGWTGLGLVETVDQVPEAA